MVFAMLGNFNFAPPTEAFPKAKAAIEEALALDDRLVEAQGLVAGMAFWCDWDWAAADEAYSRNLALNPGDAFSHADYAWFLLNRRRFDECLREIKRALDLDPLMPLFYGWSVGLNCAVGRLDEALRDFERAKEIDPAFELAYFHAGIAYFRKGMLDEAVETLRQGQRMATHAGWAEGIISLIRMRQGRREEAQRILGGMIAQRPAVNVSCMGLAWGSANLGDLDGAFQWVEQALIERDILIGFVHIYTPFFAPSMVVDARYEALLARLKLTDVAR